MKKVKPSPQNVFREAWQKMSADMDQVMPKALQGRTGRLKFSLGLALLELVVLGALGKFVYDWLVN